MARSVRAPSDWFDNPWLPGATPLTVTPDGAVYGHAACWATPHLVSGYLPPRNLGYADFHRDVVVCADGRVIRVGTVTVGTTHASLALSSPDRVLSHYRDTGVAVADVAVGPDEHGIWVAGAIRPGVPWVALLRGRSLSGDWRSVDGRPRLLALLAVDNPAFPIPAPAKEVSRR